MKRAARKSTGGVSKHRFITLDSGRPVRKSAPWTANYHNKESEEPIGSSLLESNLHLLKTGKFSDVTFIVGETKERFPSHQFLLKTRSSVFANMFSEAWNRDTDVDKEVILEDVRPETFKQFLEFIYDDTFEAEDIPAALELLQIAHKFDVKLLVYKCEQLLKSQVTLDDALQVFQAARSYEMETLMDKVAKRWAKSLSELKTHPSFPQLDKQALMYILRRQDLTMEEVDLFRLAKKWAHHQKDSTLAQSLEGILPLIRFPIMTPKQFRKAVLPTELLPASKVIEIFTYFRRFGDEDEDDDDDDDDDNEDHDSENDEARKSLAKTLGLRTQERQPYPPIVYNIPLYPEEDILNKTKESAKVVELRECLQLCNLQIQPQDTIRGIGLRSVSVHFPVDSRPALSGSTRKTFNICFKSRGCYDGQSDPFYCDDGYRELLEMSSVRAEQGEMTDMELDAIIPLKKQMVYCIEIKEMRKSCPGDGGLHFDRDKDVATDPDNIVTVDIDNICQATLDVHRIKLKGCGQDEYECPQLICKLGFGEL